MKASTLTKKLLSLIAVLMAVVMAFSACTDDKPTADADTSSVEEDVNNENEADATESEEETASDEGTESEEVTSDEGDEDTSSKKSTNTSSKKSTNTSSKKSTTTTSSKKSTTTTSSKNSTTTTSSKNSTTTTSSKNSTTNTSSKNTTNTSSKATTQNANWPDYSNVSAELKSKEVHILMWREFTKSEQKLVDDFQSKTGIKVRRTITTESEYTTKLVSLISKDAPDVVMMQSNMFPSIAINALQPLDEDVFHLDSDIWYKDYMNYYKINGNYYSVARTGSWSVDDCSYVTYYNPSVLSACGVTEMPYDLYKAGKWNWATQKEVATKVATNGATKGYSGLSLHTVDMYMLSAGVDFADYDISTSQFVNNLATSKKNDVVNAWKELVELNQTGAVTSGWSLTDIQQGKVGLFTSIAYGLYNEGGWFDKVAGGYANLQAVPVAGPTQSTAYTPVRPKTWGVAKNADNMEGAALFLSYYLDSSQIDMSSTFYNQQFETVWNIICDKSTKKRVMTGRGVCNYLTAGQYEAMLTDLWALKSSGNIASVLDSNNKAVNNAVTKANARLTRMK